MKHHEKKYSQNDENGIRVVSKRQPKHLLITKLKKKLENRIKLMFLSLHRILPKLYLI